MPEKSVTRQITIEGYAIDLMNILKFSAGTKTKFKSTVSGYLQDYYLPVDAAYEDHCVEHLELLKAIAHYKLESEDP